MASSSGNLKRWMLELPLPGGGFADRREEPRMQRVQALPDIRMGVDGEGSPRRRGGEVAGVLAVGVRIALQRLDGDVDPELLELVLEAERQTIDVVLVGRGDHRDRPRLAVGHQPLAVAVALEAVLDEQLFGNVRRVFPGADAEALEQAVWIGGHGVALLGGPGGDPRRRVGIVRLERLAVADVDRHAPEERLERDVVERRMQRCGGIGIGDSLATPPM